MKLILALLLAFVCMTANAAELLVQAKDSPHELGAKRGDIIVVRPDGWKWGKEECLPNYIVYKLPGLTEEEAKKYEESLTKEVSVTDEISKETRTESQMVKKRKYNIPLDTVDTAKTESKSVVSVASKDVTTFKTAIVEKTIKATDEIIK